jgi:transposase
MNKFSPEIRTRAVRMVLDHASEHPSLWAAVMLISAKIGCTPQALHDWVKKAEVDSGQRAGVPTDTAERLKALERENRELSRWKRSSVVLCSWLPRFSSSQSEAVSAPNDPGNKSRSNETPRAVFCLSLASMRRRSKQIRSPVPRARQLSQPRVT